MDRKESNFIAEIQASQRIREAQTNLDNMKQNLGFLGTWGRPMKSATAIEWASRMLMQSEQTFQELKNLESQAKTMREAGPQMNANQYEEQNVEERQAILNQVKTYAENKAQQEYLNKQNAIRTGICNKKSLLFCQFFILF